MDYMSTDALELPIATLNPPMIRYGTWKPFKLCRHAKCHLWMLAKDTAKLTVFLCDCYTIKGIRQSSHIQLFLTCWKLVLYFYFLLRSIVLTESCFMLSKISTTVCFCLFSYTLKWGTTSFFITFICCRRYPQQYAGMTGFKVLLYLNSGSNFLFITYVSLQLGMQILWLHINAWGMQQFI